MMTEPAPPKQMPDNWSQFPEPMRLHTITSMRDHLLALQEIDVALSQNAFDKAATIAEQRLGMSSLELHGAAHIAPFMPQGMQDIGTQMHRAASRFADRRADRQREQRCAASAGGAWHGHAAVRGLPRGLSPALIFASKGTPMTTTDDYIRRRVGEKALPIEIAGKPQTFFRATIRTSNDNV